MRRSLARDRCGPNGRDRQPARSRDAAPILYRRLAKSHFLPIRAASYGRGGAGHGPRGVALRSLAEFCGGRGAKHSARPVRMMHDASVSGPRRGGQANALRSDRRSGAGNVVTRANGARRAADSPSHRSKRVGPDAFALQFRRSAVMNEGRSAEPAPSALGRASRSELSVLQGDPDGRFWRAGG